MPNSDNEADDGTPTTTVISKSIMQRSDTTSASRVTFNRTGLPDYRTLGPERWIAAVKKLQKKKVKYSN
ncbi:hypothetical protein E2C01_090679 [Portunus trituberculatus]|uniref:Uncharacterized protein n=1 Tax=Portunus trituberculatus TaxID=210409 RepID=A0A5B7JLI3_PORTR|nr:hypothetical protein [Portunus trituberculatus]